MELPNLGERCFQTDCKQLDFLPLQCKCGKQFCSEHFNIHIQSCEAFNKQLIVEEPQKIVTAHKCAHDGCNETSLVQLLCGNCQKHFCVKHRHFDECNDKDEKAIAEKKEKYAASSRQFNEAKLAVDKQIEHNLLEAKRKGKNKNLVNKVQLMKIKNKAKGLNTIPTSERIYFNVVHPETAQGHPVFVSKNWSIGRAIDAIADECKIKNDNNKSMGKKLRLFKQDSGEILSKDLANSLQLLVDNGVIIDGESVIMEYVNDDCQFLIKSV
jgi:hypothetical protein